MDVARDSGTSCLCEPVRTLPECTATFALRCKYPLIGLLVAAQGVYSRKGARGDPALDELSEKASEEVSAQVYRVVCPMMKRRESDGQAEELQLAPVHRLRSIRWRHGTECKDGAASFAMLVT